MDSKVSARLLIDKLHQEGYDICEHPNYIMKEVFFKNCPTQMLHMASLL